MTHSKAKQPYEDAASCQTAIFEWAESFDTKDWHRLLRYIAPTLFVDYRQVMGQMWDSIPAEQFLSLASSEGFLGNSRIKTQHFIGARNYFQTGDSEITGSIRCAWHIKGTATMS